MCRVKSSVDVDSVTAEVVRVDREMRASLESGLQHPRQFGVTEGDVVPCRPKSRYLLTESRTYISFLAESSAKVSMTVPKVSKLVLI
jgi:hypothetical protein